MNMPVSNSTRPRSTTSTQDTQQTQQTPTPAQTQQAPQAPAAQQPPKDQWDGPIAQTGNAANSVKTVTDIVGGTQTRVAAGHASIGPARLPGTSSHVEGLNTGASRIAGAAGTLAGAAQLPGAVYTAQRDVRAAIANPTDANINTAVGSTAGALSTTASVTKGVLENGANIQTARNASQSATAAFRTAAPHASESVVRSASRAAAGSALAGNTARVAERATVEAGRAAVHASGETMAHALGTAGRTAARTALREGGEAAAHAAVSAVARGGASTLARGAARFAPGLNVAIAAADTAVAVSTLRDPNASTTKKVTSCITAVGSIAAATNIPVVSQVGAAVSTVSSLIGGIFG